jgi:hypothetical protein
MINTATPSVTPMIEIRVITETNVRFGRRYLRAKVNSNGNRDIRTTLEPSPQRQKAFYNEHSWTARTASNHGTRQ